MKKWILPLVLLLLFVVEILGIYFIMPFPGSQYDNTVGIAWFFHKNLIWIRILFLLIVFWQVYKLIKNKKYWRFGFTIFFLFLYTIIAWFINTKMNADTMFFQPENKIFAGVAENKIAEGKLIIGVEINNEAKAYPIEIIGYHHQVRDNVGGKEIMVTYCTVCRTGRVFDPVINGISENFRLVGMDHFNAMFEDESTGSWWRQATGEAITGKSKGTKLTEINSEQMTLAAWIRKHPQTKIMQPDTLFLKQYADLSGFDEGTINSDLEQRDENAFQFKSWVVAININSRSKAYDWNYLLEKKVINDEFERTPVLLVIENDNKSFHVWSRKVDSEILQFVPDESSNNFRDTNTNSVWNYDGNCTEGVYIGKQLIPIKSSQEFYHAWQQFNPEGVSYKIK